MLPSRSPSPRGRSTVGSCAGRRPASGCRHRLRSAVAGRRGVVRQRRLIPSVTAPLVALAAPFTLGIQMPMVVRPLPTLLGAVLAPHRADDFAPAGSALDAGP